MTLPNHLHRVREDACQPLLGVHSTIAPPVLPPPFRCRFPYRRPLFLAHTQYAGAFLMLGEALSWLDTARQCFADEHGTLTRGLLSSVFALIVGLERVFHLDEMEDPLIFKPEQVLTVYKSLKGWPAS